MYNQISTQFLRRLHKVLFVDSCFGFNLLYFVYYTGIYSSFLEYQMLFLLVHYLLHLLKYVFFYTLTKNQNWQPMNDTMKNSFIFQSDSVYYLLLISAKSEKQTNFSTRSFDRKKQQRTLLRELHIYGRNCTKSQDENRLCRRKHGNAFESV